MTPQPNPVISTAYYKYTDGDAFILQNGVDYVGTFHLINQTAYTGYYPNETAEKLTPKNTFISEVFTNQYEFDLPYNEIYDFELYYSNHFDFFNKNEITTLLNALNRNNLLIYKSLLSYNSNLFTFNNNFHFYGLSSTDADIRENDVPSGKRTYTHIDPFSFSEKWGWLDNEINYSEFIVDSNDTFKYYISNTSGAYAIRGNFSNYDPIELISSSVYTSDTIYYDELEEKLYVVDDNSIKIYNAKNYLECETENLIDEITLSSPLEFVDFGFNYRIEITNNALSIKEKETQELIYQFQIADLGIGRILNVNIRNIDDYLSILHEIDGNCYLFQSDLINYSNTLLESVGDFSQIKIFHTQFDSNLFLLRTNNTIQSRSFSNPTYPLSEMASSQLLYLRDYLYNNTYEHFDKIPIKWNSNNLKSNYFNPLSLNIKSYGAYIYMILHNIGRIYVSKGNPGILYDFNIPTNLNKNYNGVDCSESSAGFHLNVEISKILKDLLNLYTHANKKITIKDNTRSEEIIKNLELDISNCYLNSNETFNVASIQRIFRNILKIQEELISPNK